MMEMQQDSTTKTEEDGNNNDNEKKEDHFGDSKGSTTPTATATATATAAAAAPAPAPAPATATHGPNPNPNPNLYIETRDMLEYCAMSYTVGEYRVWMDEDEGEDEDEEQKQKSDGGDDSGAGGGGPGGVSSAAVAAVAVAAGGSAGSAIINSSSTRSIQQKADDGDGDGDAEEGDAATHEDIETGNINHSSNHNIDENVGDSNNSRRHSFHRAVDSLRHSNEKSTCEKLLEMEEVCRDRFLEKYPTDGPERVTLIQSIITKWQQNKVEVPFFEDTNQESELVYYIAVDPTLQRIVLAFRGSVTRTDFTADLKALPIQADITGHGIVGDKYKYATFHNGFFSYLFGDGAIVSIGDRFGRDKKNTSSSSSSNISKYNQIRYQLSGLLAQYPHYKLYVTGHSLGGALCTLFSVMTSTAPDKTECGFPSPMSCFSFAAPKVGTYVFLRLTQQAEMDGSLRFVRCINHKDPVTNVPKDLFMTCQFDVGLNIFCSIIKQREMFRHGGIELRNYRDGSGYAMEHLPHNRWTFAFTPRCISDFSKNVVRALSMLLTCVRCGLCLGENFRSYHTWLLYFKRLDANQVGLEQLYVDELYEAIHDGDHSLVKTRY